MGDDLRFAEPWLLLLLLLLPLMALALFPRAARASALRVGTLATAASASRRTWRVRFEPIAALLRIGAAALLIVGLARPQTADTAASDGEGIDIVLAFDVSSSMTQPFGGRKTRMEAAKDVLTTFVQGRQDDRVALVAFQGSSITLSPLTTDYNAVSQAIGGADRLLLADGTAIGVALGESVNVLRGSNAVSRIVILMTDGENNAGDLKPLAAARIAERLGARVYTVGVVGTEPGFGSRTNVDEASLRSIADVTGGTYSRAEDQESLQDVYDGIDELETSRFNAQASQRYRDIAQIALAGAAALLVLEIIARATLFRRAP